jgi:hypothetical protein
VSYHFKIIHSVNLNVVNLYKTPGVNYALIKHPAYGPIQIPIAIGTWSPSPAGPIICPGLNEKSKRKKSVRAVSYNLELSCGVYASSKDHDELITPCTDRVSL